MKNHKFTFQKSNIALNWIELLELKHALAKAIKDNLELEKNLGLEPQYFSSTKHLIKIYKQVIIKYKQY